MTTANRLAGVICAAAVLPSGAAHGASEAPGRLWVYVGTYTDGKRKGVYRFEFDPASGELTGGELAATAVNPSFLAVHPSRCFLYAVNEVLNFAGKPTGGVSAFALDPANGKLTHLNSQPSEGSDPCHLVVDRAGNHVLVANYGGGSAAVLPVGGDGRLGPATAVVHHKGVGVNRQRQEAPHAHSVNLDAANRFAVVADLGLDRVLVYHYDANKGALTPNEPRFVPTAPGAGPRHFAFHPSAPFAYVINELDSTVVALAYDAAKGTFKPLQTVSTLPLGFKGESGTAEVQVHPSGRFLFGSNRGHDSIAVFAIDPNAGTLTPAGHTAEGIKTPRNFGIDPTGQFLIVANQGSDSLVVFRIDPQTGIPRPTGHRVDVPAPVCVKFVRRQG
jgi:6-phosphogluconolactonase